MDAQRIAEIKKWLQEHREEMPLTIQFGRAEDGQKQPPLIADLEELLNFAEAGLRWETKADKLPELEAPAGHNFKWAIEQRDRWADLTVKWREWCEDAEMKLATERQKVDEQAQELRAIEMALGNCLALDECRTRAEKVAKAMEMARKVEELQKGTERAQRALDAAGAPQYNPMDETEGWGHAQRIAWLHTEKGLADARLTALQKVWQEKVEALTERATSAERCRDEFQKRLEPLYGQQPGTVGYAFEILRRACMPDMTFPPTSGVGEKKSVGSMNGIPTYWLGNRLVDKAEFDAAPPTNAGRVEQP